MNIAIIVFSPSGHTLKAAKMIEKSFIGKEHNVKLVDITGKTEFMYGDKIKETVKRELDEYDVLFIGGPLYAGHVEHNVLNIIRVLPRPDRKRSNLAVPFVTFGGVHSSVALEEMGKKLKWKRYKSLLGIKIASQHTLTVTYSNVIYKDKPGPEEEKIINEAVKRVIAIVQNEGRNAKDQSKTFKYAPPMERFMLNLFTQEAFHKKFKNVAVNTGKCIKCKKCIAVCPVDMFTYSDGAIRMHRNNNNCILCAECFHNCPAGAIEHPYIQMARHRLKDGFAKLEEIPSAIHGGP